GHSIEPISSDERLSWEREFLGMYLSDHPLRRIAGDLQSRVDTSINELGPHLDGLLVQIGGSLRDVRAFVPRRSTSGQRMAFLQVEDLTGSVEVVVFARTFEECAELLRPDAVVVVRGKVESNRVVSNGTSTPVSVDEEERTEVEPAKILAEAVYAWNDPRLAAWRRDSTVHINVAPDRAAHLAQLRDVLQHHGGDCPVVLHVETEASVDDITLPAEFGVDPGPGLERAVEQVAGDGSYRVEIRRLRAAEREPRAAARSR
ncbi:MAG: hypothetical protein JOY68_02465, partial [Candidatus Dormibacteraeota bacterium]|nr:hypothetical protein [Candidatus Dormibacteraeota bacterium]